jgi:signal transduction histidine kinase
VTDRVELDDGATMTDVSIRQAGSGPSVQKLRIGQGRPVLLGWMRPLPYALITASLLLAGISDMTDGTPGWRFGAAAGVSVVAAGWTFLMLRRRKDAASLSTRRLAIYFVVRLVFTAALVVINPWFGVYAWFGYPEAIAYFAMPSGLLAIGGTALVAATSYLGGPPTSVGTWVLYFILVAGSIALVGAIGISTLRRIDQQSERDRMMADLVETNERLADALRENRGLQNQLVTQAREAGVLDERARLAGEIHDTLAQALTGIITQLEAAGGAGEVRRDDPRHVTAAIGLARSGLADARRSLHALRPEPLVGSRLPEAVSETAAQWSALSGVPVMLDITGTVVPLDADREIAALRAAQEGLANVGKHARATKVGLTLSYLENELLIDVRDDGIGFSPLDIARSGGGHSVGLHTMRERLARAGGELQIESEPGEGTALVARVPFGRGDQRR